MQIKLSHLPIGQRIGLALAIPIGGLLLLAVWIITGYYQTARDMDKLYRMAELAPAVSSLVHEMQLERGISAATISSAEGSAFAERLPERYAQTDRRRAELRVALEHYDEMPSTMEQSTHLQPRIDGARQKLLEIGDVRRAIADRNLPVSAATGYYTDAIAGLIGIAEAMLLADVPPQLTRSIAGYTRLLHLKERAGQERAIGSVGFAAKRFDTVSHLHLAEHINLQRVYLREFHFYATPAQSEFFEQTMYGLNEAEVWRLRRIALGGGKLFVERRRCWRQCAGGSLVIDWRRG